MGPGWTWLRGRQGDMVWSAVVLVTVMLPLAALTLDIPRYYRLAGQLNQALEAAAQDAALTCMDMAHFEHTGQIRMRDSLCLQVVAEGRFQDNVDEILGRGGMFPQLVAVAYDPARQRVHVEGQAQMDVFFGLTPRITVRRTANSYIRMVVR